MILETCLTVLSMTESATRLYDWFTGLSAGHHKDQAVGRLAARKATVQRLSDKILYAPEYHQAINKKNSETLSDPRKVYELVQPIAEALDTDVLASAVNTIPVKMREAFKKDPWEVLIDIRPANRTKQPTNPDYIPVTFIDNNLSYIGWQTRGALPQLFDCEFEQSGSLWVPHSQPEASARIITPVKGTNVKLRQALTEFFQSRMRVGEVYFHIAPGIRDDIFKHFPPYRDVMERDEIVAVLSFWSQKNYNSCFVIFGLKGLYFRNTYEHLKTEYEFIPFNRFYVLSYSKKDTLTVGGTFTMDFFRPPMDKVKFGGLLEAVRKVYEAYDYQ
jgi:hypothetical protein